MCAQIRVEVARIEQDFHTLSFHLLLLLRSHHVPRLLPAQPGIVGRQLRRLASSRRLFRRGLGSKPSGRSHHLSRRPLRAATCVHQVRGRGFQGFNAGDVTSAEFSALPSW